MQPKERLSDLAETLSAPDYANGISGLAYTLALAPLLALTPVVRALPATWKVYHKLHTWSAYQMQKAAGADAVADIELTNGKADVRPAKYVESDEDEKNRSGWKVKGLGDKRYDPTVFGSKTMRFGKADKIGIYEDGTDQATMAEAAIDNAFLLDRESYLFRDAAVSITNVFREQQPQQAAVADGGQAEPVTEHLNQNVTLTRPGVLQDALVPLNSRAGYDGQVVSWSQFQHVKDEASDQETIRDAKNQSWAAAKLDDIERGDLLKWVLIACVIGFVLLFHQDIGALISNFGGGGGDAVGDAAGGALG